jgi:tetratricopeptide (TPR) repeat protein
MQKITPKPQNESPFFNLLADADEVQIREIPADAPERMMSSLEKTLKDFSHTKDASLRTFFVHIKTPALDKSPLKAEKAPYAADQLRVSAELLLENQDYILARNLYSFLLQQNLRDAVGLRGLGICLFKLGEVVSSRKCFRALTELYQSEEAEYWLGLGYQAEGKDAIASAHFEKVQKPQTFHADQRFDYFKNFGNCLTRLGQLDRAEALYIKALELSPTSDTIHVNLGTLLIQRREWNLARERFMRAAEINPNSSRALCGMGLTALALGQVTEAKAFFHRSLDLDAQNLVALHQLVELCQNPEEFTTLKTRLRGYLEKDPNHADSHFALGALLFKEGSWKACELHVARALEIDPRHAGAMKLRADLNSLVRSQSVPK